MTVELAENKPVAPAESRTAASAENTAAALVGAARMSVVFAQNHC